MPRKTITQTAPEGAETPLTADELAAIRAEHADHGAGVWCGATPSVVDEEDPDPDHCLPYRLAGEVERLQGDLERAHEELRQGWPKMTYEANRAAIEAMNERDEALAEVERLRAENAQLWYDQPRAPFSSCACHRARPWIVVRRATA